MVGYQLRQTTSTHPAGSLLTENGIYSSLLIVIPELRFLYELRGKRTRTYTLLVY